MRAYMGYTNGAPEDGAVLVFAKNARRAKVLAYKSLCDWFEFDWVDTRVEWIRNLPKHLKQYDTGEESVVESPETCLCCEMWVTCEMVGETCVNCLEEYPELAGEASA